MKRGLLFRAFVKLYDGSFEMINDYCFLNTDENNFFGTDLINERPDVLDVIDVMQFTGLSDKNGTNIFEGDIVKVEVGNYTDKAFEVIYKDGSFQIKIKEFSYGISFVTFFEQCVRYVFGIEADNYAESMKYIEVIGNIHENPELLK